MFGYSTFNITCNKLVKEEELTSRGTHLTFELDEPVLGTSVLGTPQEMPLAITNDEFVHSRTLETKKTL